MGAHLQKLSKQKDIKEFEREVKELWYDRHNIIGLTFSNIPNFLTILRVVLTFVVMYMILSQASLFLALTIFVIAALTDLFDGRLARRFKWESEFGRQADMIADRFLWIGTALAFVISFGIVGLLQGIIGVQLLFIMAREIISAPFVLIALFGGNPLPQARYVAKVTTFVQAFALPVLILSTLYPWMIYLSFPLSVVCLVTGFISALYYLKDIHAPRRKK